MIKKMKRFYSQKILRNRGGRKWVLSRPINRTLGPDVKLEYPNVFQPTPEQINGEYLSSFPSYIAVEVTNVCNLQCKHCNYRYGLDHYTRDRGFATYQTVEKILTEVKKYGATVLMNYDGEPLMHNKFLDLLELATNLNIKTYFNTNGTLFTKDFTDKLIKFYRGSVFFSIDGNKEWFERIRISANYEQVIKNLNYFIEVNKSNGWPITIGVSLCNIGQTPDERKDFLDLWLPKVNYVSMGEVNDEYGTMISDPMTVLKPKMRPICAIPWQTCGICYNGDVIPCSIYITRANKANAIFGNIWEQSIREIWHGEAFRNFRKNMAEERYNCSFCDKCQRWLSQFNFPPITEGSIKINRNGFWTTFQNLDKGQLNFQ